MEKEGFSPMRKVIAAFASFAVILLSSPAFATRQFQEILIYKGEKMPLYNHPLESYFNFLRPRPSFPIRSTAGYRGYRGVWEIKKGYLFLNKLQEACFEDAADMFSFRVFPFRRPPIKATWFSGKIHAYDYVAEQELELTFRGGTLIGERVYDSDLASDDRQQNGQGPQ